MPSLNLSQEKKGFSDYLRKTFKSKELGTGSSSMRNSFANFESRPLNPFLEKNKMKSTAIINTVQKKLLGNVEEMSGKKLQALNFINQMQ